MEYKCQKCESPRHNIEKICIGYTNEVVTVVKCADCGTIIDAEIKRPKGTVLRRKYSAREIRFSENERRNFASITLSMLEKQVQLLAKIASATGVDKKEIDKIVKNKMDRFNSSYLIGEDDMSILPDLED